MATFIYIWYIQYVAGSKVRPISLSGVGQQQMEDYVLIAFNLCSFAMFAIHHFTLTLLQISSLLLTGDAPQTFNDWLAEALPFVFL